MIKFYSIGDVVLEVTDVKDGLAEVVYLDTVNGELQIVKAFISETLLDKLENFPF